VKTAKKLSRVADRKIQR